MEKTFVGIAGVVAGVSAGIIVLMAIFASERLWVAIPIVAILALMGILLGYFAYKSRRWTGAAPPENDLGREHLRRSGGTGQNVRNDARER